MKFPPTCFAHSCHNDGRCINDAGEWHCGLCDLAQSRPSIRASDLPNIIEALAVVYDVYAPYKDQRAASERLKEMLCLKNR